MDKITLDGELFKTLESETRRAILKSLDVRQRTVTELARELELNKATVFEHLERLAAAGLIQKIEEDVERKWVYWQLTWKGKRILHPREMSLAILLSTAGGAIAAAFASVWLWLRSAASAPEGAPEGPSIMAQPVDAPVEAAPLEPLWLGVAAAFALLALALVAWALVVRRRARASI